MGIWKALFGGSEESPEQEKKTKEESQFELFKYDGMKALRMGQLDYAVKCCERALELHDDAEVRDTLAQTLVRQGHLEEAMDHYMKLAVMAPENEALLLQMAHLAYMQEDYGHMAALCDRVISLNADNAQAHYQRAQAYLGTKDEVQAVDQLNMSIRLADDMYSSYLLRGQTLLDMGDVAGADADALFLLEHVGEQEDVLMLKAKIEKTKGDLQQTILIYNKVIDQNPFHIDAYKERGQVYQELGDQQHAMEDMEKVMELDPQSMADVSSERSSEGIEQKVKEAYSNNNPLGF